MKERPHNGKMREKSEEADMGVLKICAIVIAVSMFTMAVEYVYGWSRVKPLTEDAWSTISQWSDAVIGEKEKAERVDASKPTTPPPT